VEILRTFGDKVPEHMERFRFFESMYADATSVDKFEHLLQSRKFDASKHVMKVKNSVKFENSYVDDEDGEEDDDYETPFDEI
jgi:hypothetical protein